MTKRITILAYGSRGDVQPFLALSLRLAQEGFAVRLAAPEIFRPAIAETSIEFASLPGDPTELINTLVQKAGSNPLKLMRVVVRYALPIGISVLRAAREAARDADLILHSFLMTIAGHEVARERSVPDLSCQLFPFLPPTRSYPALGFPVLGLGEGYNRLTHRLAATAFWQSNRLAYAWVRRKTRSLPPLTGWPFKEGNPHRPEILVAVSPSLLPRPVDWDTKTHLTGYWFVPADRLWAPPEPLAAFLAARPAPVYIGFGSMIHRLGPEWPELFLRALKETGQRALVAAGWGGLEMPAEPDLIYPLVETPHEWLFQRVAAAVHHGGAGTTGTALRAGIPSVIVPFIADQPFWGRRVADVGAGPTPIPARKLTVGKLAAALDQAVNNPAVRLAAQRLGAAVSGEDGVGEAVKVILRYF